MAAFYDFRREDGSWVTLTFPFGQCPSEIVCEDGVRAVRGWRTAPNVSWKAGHEPSVTMRRQAEERYRANVAAGRRGEHAWRERVPKI